MQTLLPYTGNFFKEATRKAAITLAEFSGIIGGGNSSASAVTVRPKPQLSILNAGQQEGSCCRGTALSEGCSSGKTHISAAGLRIHFRLSLGQPCT